MTVCLVTDIEGVAGVIDGVNWIHTDSRFFETGKRLLTEEVNAAAAGFFEAGADRIVVLDGHGPGAINIELLDERCEMQRESGVGRSLYDLEESYNITAWVGQHAMSRTVGAHLAHSQSFEVFEIFLNGNPIGEFGQFVYAAAEQGVMPIFGSGDLAFTKEARELSPSIVTAAVKRGLSTQSGDECGSADYEAFNIGAIHLQPRTARKRIREGARNAMTQYLRDPDSFSIKLPKPPYEMILRIRPISAEKTFVYHASTIGDLWRTWLTGALNS